MALVRIHLLGGFLLDFAERNLPPIPSAVGRSLFAYLVTNRSRRHTRDLLAGTFWPDLPESAARRRLSQALWQIQAVLNEASPAATFLDASATDVAFDAPAVAYWLDVAEFDRHVAAAHQQRMAGEPSEAGDLEAAVALYRGEFLAGFYDDWTTLERERLRADYLGSLDRLIAIYKGRADYETALSFARRLSLHDPLRESAQRDVMRLCFLLGRSNEALQQYERCVQILAEELDTVPTAETTELRNRISQLRAKGETAFVPTAISPLLDTRNRVPLVGRIDERAAILHRMDDAVAGQGGIVFIEGQSGVGKTRLLEQLIDDAQWRGLSVLHVTCEETEMLHPFGAIRGALESGLTRLRVDQLEAMLRPATLRDLSTVLPQLASGSTDPSPASSEKHRRLEYAVEETLLAMADLNATALVLDDVQWIDQDSVETLSRLVPRLAGSGLLICLGYRPSAARRRPSLWRRLLDIDASARVDRVSLEPLDREEVAALVAESLGGRPVSRDAVEGLFLETGGNPLFILESLRGWHEQIKQELDMGEPVPTARIGEGLPLSGGVARVIRRRLDHLPPESLAVLETAAVMGIGVDVSILEATARLSRSATLSSLDRLMRRGAMTERGRGYEFSHDQVRRVVLDGLTAGDRARLHGRVGAALEERAPDELEALAYHFTEAGDGDKAYRYSLDAGRRARRLGAFATAAAHFERAASWPEQPGRFDLLAELEDALDVLGRRSDQGRVLEEMAPLADGPGRGAAVARRTSRLLDHEGRHQEAIAEAQLAVERAPEEQRGAMLQNLGLVLGHAGKSSAAVPHLEAAVELMEAEDSSSAGAVASALCDLGSVLGDLQEYGRAARALGRALEGFEQADDRYGMAEAIGRLATVRMEQGEGAAAVSLYESALELSRELDYRRGEAVNLANLGNALYFQGRVGEALERYAEAAGVFSRIGDERGAALLRANAASVRLTVVGDDSVEADVTRSMEFFEREKHAWGQAFCHEHMAAIAHKRGDTPNAMRHIETGLKLLADGGHRWVEAHLQRLAAQVSLDAGNLPSAREAVWRAAELCDEIGLEEVTPTVEALAAAIAFEHGEGNRALDIAREATASLDGRAEQAYAVWYRHFQIADALGHRREARDCLASAVSELGKLLDSLPPEDRSLSEAQVPMHRGILAARDRVFARSVGVEVPRLGVPLGRPLRADETITVNVTVSDPADFAVSNERDRRSTRLRRLVREAEEQGGAMRVKDLAVLLGVSIATVRRDLGDIRRSGIDVRTRGSR